MSKQQQAKQTQGYRSVPTNCGNCKNRTSETSLPAWMESENKEAGSVVYAVEKYGVERQQRCSLGGFAVKKTASCNQWAPLSA